ncbi:MAG: MBL fold metallo-hydrolase [Clostridia bacterium]|nr:MBL fold metallo-hydrolase [Clostridia bacterium]
MDLRSDYLSEYIPKEHVGIWFLGQAGFLLKTPDGKKIALDPYLSDCCRRYFGFKRLMPVLIRPGDVIFDELLISHSHYDHFDVDSVPVMMSSGRTELICAPDCLKECERLGIRSNITVMRCGEVIDRGSIRITALPCDHGSLAPDALAFRIEVGPVAVGFMGDTALRTDYLQKPEFRNLDVLILPINGAYGNLNEEEASRVCAELKPKLAVPCHYWNFAEHGGNPGLFMKKMAENAADVPLCVMRQGEGIVIGHA